MTDIPIDVVIEDDDEILIPSSEDHSDHVHIPFETEDDKPPSTRDRLLGRRKVVAAKKAAAKRAPKERVVVPKARPGHFVKPLNELYTSVGMMMLPFDPMCGTAVVKNAESCAKSMDRLAQENDAVRRALNAILTTGAWGGVIAAHLPILAMVMAHHGPEKSREVVAPLASMLNTDPKSDDYWGSDSSGSDNAT